MKNTRIVITGVPGTGKTTLAKSLSKLLGVPCISINEFAISHKYYMVHKGEKEKTVDLRKLQPALKKHLAALDGYVVEGHLACEFSIPADVVIVLRANPALLKKIYAERKYPDSKANENLLCEILDYCTQKSEDNFKHSRILQLDNSHHPDAKKIFGRMSKGESDSINWMPLLLTKGFSYLTA